ncbi:hypothetical protein [Paraburkholderia susongensis]|uniref:hypothetical protein n=1 Tax=Paraburkholderia susongensis TaxID=1515439 RepID=UPI00117C3C2B|nr:hypothetical protein [Paraburkholderia susongensis]
MFVVQSIVFLSVMHRENFEFAFVTQIREIREVIDEFLAQYVEITTTTVSAEDPKCCAKRRILSASNRDPPRLIFAGHYSKACAVLRITDYFPTTPNPNFAMRHGHLT